MKKITQLFLLLTMVASVAFAQQTKNFSTERAKKADPVVAENILVPSVNESFEGTFPPAGWAIYSPDGGTGWNQQTVGTTPIPGWNGGVVTPTPTGSGGTKMAFCTWSTGGAASNDQWLVTPQITIATGYNLYFQVRKFGSYLDLMDIKVSTTNNQIASFTATLASISWSAADSGWSTKVYNLDAYAGQNIYIAFNEHVVDNFTDGAAIFVDLVKVDLGAGISQPNSSVSFRMFPNPVNDMLHIEAASAISRVKVANLLGQVMTDVKVDGKKTQIETNDLTPGVYFVTVVTENGTISRKINVNH